LLHHLIQKSIFLGMGVRSGEGISTLRVLGVTFLSLDIPWWDNNHR